MRKLTVAAAAILGLTMLPVAAHAAAITGTMNIAGSVIVDADTIDWVPPIGGGNGQVDVKFPGTEYFANIFNPGVGSPYFSFATDLQFGVNDPPLANFLSGFKEVPEVPSEYDDLSFTLTEITAPSAPACAGDGSDTGTCAFGFFTLTDTVNGVDVGFDIKGFWVDPTFGDDGSLNNAIGLYTTQLDRLNGFDTIQDVIDQINGGGSISATYSATITAEAVPEVPEPASMLLLGSGLVGLAAARRRAKKQ